MPSATMRIMTGRNHNNNTNNNHICNHSSDRVVGDGWYQLLHLYVFLFLSVFGNFVYYKIIEASLDMFGVCLVF